MRALVKDDRFIINSIDSSESVSANVYQVLSFIYVPYSKTCISYTLANSNMINENNTIINGFILKTFIKITGIKKEKTAAISNLLSLIIKNSINRGKSKTTNKGKKV